MTFKDFYNKMLEVEKLRGDAEWLRDYAVFSLMEGNRRDELEEASEIDKKANILYRGLEEIWSNRQQSGF